MSGHTNANEEIPGNRYEEKYSMLLIATRLLLKRKTAQG
jgi:hypothetical protein